MLLEEILPLVRTGKSITRNVPNYNYVLSCYVNSYTDTLNWKCVNMRNGNACSPSNVTHNDLLCDDWIVVNKLVSNEN